VTGASVTISPYIYIHQQLFGEPPPPIPLRFQDRGYACTPHFLRFQDRGYACTPPLPSLPRPGLCLHPPLPSLPRPGLCLHPPLPSFRARRHRGSRKSSLRLIQHTQPLLSQTPQRGVLGSCVCDEKRPLSLPKERKPRDLVKTGCSFGMVVILLQVHLQQPCYDFCFL
jgi:hypothetical protein